MPGPNGLANFKASTKASSCSNFSACLHRRKGVKGHHPIYSSVFLSAHEDYGPGATLGILKLCPHSPHSGMNTETVKKNVSEKRQTTHPASARFHAREMRSQEHLPFGASEGMAEPPRGVSGRGQGGFPLAL